MTKLICKGCGHENHPVYHRKYEGYCLQCSNAGVDERDDKIAELEARLARAEDAARQLMTRLCAAGALSRSSVKAVYAASKRQWPEFAPGAEGAK